MSEPEDQPTALSNKAPSPPIMHWTTIWNARNTVEANLAVMKLQEAGLRARVDMENSSTLGAWAGMPLGTCVQVMQADIEPARKMLLEIDHHREVRQQLRPNCPKCGKSETRRVASKIRWFAAGCFLAVFPLGFELEPLALWILMLLACPLLLLWPLTPRWECTSCGHHWISPEPELPDEDDEEVDEGDSGESD